MTTIRTPGTRPSPPASPRSAMTTPVQVSATAPATGLIRSNLLRQYPLTTPPGGPRLLPAPLRARPADLLPPVPVLPSHTATWRDLVVTDATHRLDGHAPPLPPRWEARWTVTTRRANTKMVTPVGLLRWPVLDGADPMIVADWHPKRRARAGLAYVSGTGRHHPFSSLGERRVLVALDFHGVNGVVSQPFTLRWHDGRTWRRHTPDFAVRTAEGVSLINVRPEKFLDERHHRNTAAVQAVADLAGWSCDVVTGFRTPAMDIVEACAADRQAPDRAGLAAGLLSVFRDGPVRFADAADSTDAWGFNRQLLRAFVHDRLLSVDLNRRLTDSSVLTAVDA